MPTKIKTIAITPEVMSDEVSVAMQFPDINFNFEIKDELEASAQKAAKLSRSMFRETVKEISETEQESLSKIKTIHVVIPIIISLGNPELTIELK